MHGSGFLRQSAIHFSPYAHGRFFLSAFLIFLFVLAPLAPLLHPPFVERQQAHAFAELSGFAYRKRIVIDNTNVDSNLSNFPLYVKVNADTGVGAAAQADGDDIRFATATGMLLPYEEESFLISSGSGSGNYWVKVPTVLTATGTVLYMYYGSGSAVDGQNVTGVWDSNYKGVWHLKESVAGYPTEGDVIDSTGNNNDGAGWSASPDMTPDLVDAKLSRGQLFDGANDSLYVADSASLSQTGTMTLSTWYKLTSAATDYDFLTGKMTNGNWTDGYGLFFTDDFSGNTVVFHAQGWNVNRAYVTFNWTSDTSWHYVVGRYDGSNVKINLDASAGTSDAYSGGISDTATYFTMGAGQYSDGASVDYYPPITLDEVRISAVARSDAWVKFEYYNINESDQEVSWAAEESANSAPTITSVTDSPDPVDEGEDVTFSVDWNDANAEGIKMYVCKAADGTSAGCGEGGTWCSASGSYALTDPITCSYTTAGADAGVQNYYAYVCDDSAACSSASSGTFSVTAWLSGFTKRKRIAVDNTNVDSNLSNFPLYVKVNADADVGAAAQSDGDDIRFATSTGMLLPFEEESFSIRSGSGSGNYWVKVPTVLTATGTVIYLYYGSGSAVDGQNVTGVWDANYDGVWHLNETSGSTAYDSTANGRDLAQNNTPTLGVAGAWTGGLAYSFDQANSEWLGPSALFARSDSYCMEAWAKWVDIGYQNGLLNYGSSEYWARHIYTAGNSGVHPLLHYDQSHSGGFYVNLGNPGSDWFFTATSVERQGANDYDYNSWLNDSHIDGSHAGGDNTLSYSFSIGNNVFDPMTWNGSIDEVRVSKIFRSAHWLKFEYYNMSAADQELSFSAEESTAANSAPTITSVTDSPDPVDEGEDVTFSVDWNDADTEGIKMYVCKAADGTSAGCGAGGTWCSNSNDFDLTDPITCSYTVTSADAGTQNYYAYVCDDSAACSSASSGTFSVTAWLSGFTKRKRIAVDNTYVDSNLSNFPLYVKINADTDVGSSAQADGDDIRFATATGMILPYEEESFLISSGSGSGNYWVKVPTVLTATGTVIYLYYGSGSAVDGQNVTGVWDSNFKGVYHFGNGASLSTTDSTGTNDLTNSNATAVAGRIFGAAGLNGSTQYLYKLTPTGFPTGTSARTYSIWFKKSSSTMTKELLGHGANSTDGDRFGMWFGSSPNSVGAEIRNGGSSFSWTYDSSWHYLALTLPSGGTAASQIDVYYDGADASPSPSGSATINTANTEFAIGRIATVGISDYYFDGFVDEVRVSTIDRSAAWTKFEYNNISAADQEVSFSAEESTAVNSAPTITSVTDAPDPVDEGEDVTFSVDWNDANAEGIKMYVCKAADATSAGCGAGGTWCGNSDDFDLTDPITCTYTATDADAGTQNYYAYVCDDAGSCSAATAGTFSVSKWLSGFTKRKRIVVDNTYVDSNLSNFPLYVKVNADTDVGAAAQADGDDIRFATATGMVLAHEEESFLVSSGSGSGNFWVRVPTVLTSTGTIIYLYYGSGSAADGQSASGVWDSNYKGVWHLHQGVADSTSTANNGTDDGTADEAGRVGHARDFEAGDTDRISLGLNGIGPDLTGGTAVVTEAWIKPEAYTSGQYDNAVFTVFGGSDNKWYVDLGIRGNDSKIRMAGRSQDADTYLEAASTNTVSTAAWTHIVGILNIPNDQILFYKNGAPDGSAAASFGGATYTHTSAAAKPDGIGAVDSAPYYGWFDGLIDEVRVSNVLRSAAWIKFEYYNMGESDQEVSWAAEEGLTVTLSGTVYSDEGSTPLGSQTVRIAIDGVDQDTTAESDAGDGTWSIAGLTISAGQVVTAYLEDETVDAVTVTVSNGSGLADLDLYQDHLIVRADNGAAVLTNANLATAAVGSETDISGMYSVSSSNITVVSGKEILVWSGDAYTPGGTVTTPTLDVRGTFTQGNYALSISSAYQQSGGTFAGGGAAITVTGTFTLSGGAFTSTSTTLTLYGSWAHTDGTFTHNGGAVLIDRLSPGSANTINVPTTATFNTLTIQGHDNVTTISDGDTLIVVGTFTWGNSNPSFPLYGLNGGTVEARAGVTVNVGARGGSTLLTFLVGGDQTITGGGTVGPLTISKSSGMVNVTGNLASGAFTLTSGTFASTTGTFSIYGNWTHTAGGTFNHNYGTVVIDRATPGSSDTIDVTGTETFNHLTIRGHDSYRTIAAGDTLIALGTFALGHTEMSYPLYGMNGGTIEARGNVVMNVRSADGSTALSFTGTGAQTYTDLGGLEPDGTITVNKPSGTVTLASNADWNASGQDLAITSGTLNIAGYTLAVADQFTIGASGTLKLQGAETVSAIDSNAGTVEFTGNGNSGENTYTVTTLATSYQNLTVNSADGTTDTFQLGAALDVNGDFTIKAGAFVAGSGITLAGDWIKKAASTFAHDDGTVTLDGTSQTMSGSTTFYDFSKTVASADTLTWESGSTQTIAAGGSITLNGAEDNLLTLAPSVAESAWNLDVDATASQSVSYVSVSYSDASGGAEIDASDGTNTDGGNTTNWDFGGAAPAKKNYFWFF